jgi:hypothetical protein
MGTAIAGTCNKIKRGESIAYTARKHVIEIWEGYYPSTF